MAKSSRIPHSRARKLPSSALRITDELDRRTESVEAAMRSLGKAIKKLKVRAPTAP